MPAFARIYRSVMSGGPVLRSRSARGRVVLAFSVALVAGLTATAVAVFAGDVRNDGRAPQPEVIVQEQPPADAALLTLLEAWDRLEAALSAWGPSWRIASLASTDVHDQPAAASGRDGRRASWQAEVFDEQTGEVRWLRITGGALVDAASPGWVAPRGALTALERPAIDSPQAVEAALAAKPTFGPGTDKAVGFHFSYGRDASTGEVALAVLGAVDGQPVRVLFDPGSGAVRRAERLNVVGGGLLVSRDGGERWDRASLGGFVQAIVADAALGERAPLYAAVWDGDALALWRSPDGGASWARVAVLPPSAGPAAHAVAVGALEGAESVLIATNGGLWAYRIPSDRLEPVDAPGVVLALAVDADGTWHAIAMQPGDPSSARHYVRGPLPGAPWEEVGDGRVTALASGAGLAAYGGSGSGQLALLGGDVRVRATGTALERSADGGKSWELVAAGPFTAVIAVPGGSTAYAVRFPATLLRSEDGGRTWEEAAAIDAPQGVELFAPLPGVLVAGLGAAFQWQPF